MTEPAARKARPPTRDRSPRALARRRRDPSNLQRRLQAAGLKGDAADNDTEPSVDEVRFLIARLIVMIMNQWHGCRQPLCRRFRGCMAPDGTCTNLPPLTLEEEANAPAEIAEVRAALCEAFARRDREEEHGKVSGPPHPDEVAPRRRQQQALRARQRPEDA